VTAKGGEPPLDRLRSVVSRVQAAVNELQALAYELATEQPVGPESPEEYLSLKELCSRIPYKQQTIRNLLVQGVLRNGEHFIQRQRYAKVVFVWSAMQRWLREHQQEPPEVEPFIPTHARSRKIR
jgi:hypothetical protein